MFLSSFISFSFYLFIYLSIYFCLLLLQFSDFNLLFGFLVNLISLTLSLSLYIYIYIYIHFFFLSFTLNIGTHLYFISFSFFLFSYIHACFPVYIYLFLSFSLLSLFFWSSLRFSTSLHITLRIRTHFSLHHVIVFICRLLLFTSFPSKYLLLGGTHIRTLDRAIGF